MDPKIYPTNSPRIGQYVETGAGSEKVRAYVPPPLPPDPPLELGHLYALLDEANQALGRLDGMASVLPGTALFLYMYVRKEALLSSQIEGTQSSLSDLLLFEDEEAPGVPIDDVKEVSNYIAAMNHGLERLKSLPLSLRLTREIHKIMLAGNRGHDKQPGAFRDSQNWIGGTRPGNAAFVPPPPQNVMPCMGALEKFIHDEEQNLPVLIKAGLVHVQFETIHPFLDGNGRVGRLLITLMLCSEGVLREPLLYLSLYFKQNRDAYYRLLNEVRQRGTWETWLEFFLTGVRDTAVQAGAAAQNILDLFQEDRDKIETMGRAASSALRVHEFIQNRPLTTVENIEKQTGMAYATVNRAVQGLEKHGILREITGGRRNRVFVYDAYMKILEQGTEPL